MTTFGNWDKEAFEKFKDFFGGWGGGGGVNMSKPFPGKYVDETSRFHATVSEGQIDIYDNQRQTVDSTINYFPPKGQGQEPYPIVWKQEAPETWTVTQQRYQLKTVYTKTFRFTKLQEGWEFIHVTYNDENGDQVDIKMTSTSTQTPSWNPIHAFWEFIFKLLNLLPK